MIIEGHHEFLQRKVYSWEEYKVDNKQMKVVIDIKKTCLFKCIKQVVKKMCYTSKHFFPKPFNSLITCRWSCYKTTSSFPTYIEHGLAYQHIFHSPVNTHSGRPQTTISFNCFQKEFLH